MLAISTPELAIFGIIINNLIFIALRELNDSLYTFAASP
jgi:hypothetical protein